jgi:hypothetical protein
MSDYPRDERDLYPGKRRPDVPEGRPLFQDERPCCDLSRAELEAKLVTADAMYSAQGRSLEDCRELLAEAQRDGDGWCERASKAETAAAFWKHEYEAAQEHVNDLKRRLGWSEESVDDE